MNATSASSISWVCLYLQDFLVTGTFELLAFENGQRIGCINGYGNFITGSLACYPFNTVGTPVEEVAIRGYEPCSASNGSLVCYQAAGSSSLFGVSERFMCPQSLCHSILTDIISSPAPTLILSATAHYSPQIRFHRRLIGPAFL